MPIKIQKRSAIAEIVQTFRRISKAVQQHSGDTLKRYGLTEPQLWLLKRLGAEGDIAVSALSQAIDLHVSTVSGIVKRLEARGYILRKGTGQDRRKVILCLTDKGKAMIAQVPRSAGGRLVSAVQKQSRKDILGLYHGLKKVVELMDANRV